MGQITLKNLEMYFKINNVETKVLDDVNLEIKEGEFVSIIGPSGCGKSTIISLVAGLRFPSGGKVLVNGQEVKGPGPDRGVVFQDYTLFPWMTAADNICFALEQVTRGISKQELRTRSEKFLEVVGLKEFANSYPAQLSGGMQQRVAIARAFALNPGILLMDEPFGAADALTRTHLQDLLLHLWEAEKRTVLIVTHDIDEALVLSDKIVVMTPRPARIKEIVEIDFSRPRCRTNLQANPGYLALRAHLYGLFQAELSQDLTSQKNKITEIKTAKRRLVG